MQQPPMHPPATDPLPVHNRPTRPRPRSWLLHLFTLLAVVTLAAGCGSSGGGGGSTPDTASFEVRVCGAEVPEPTNTERECSDLTITYEATP